MQKQSRLSFGHIVVESGHLGSVAKHPEDPLDHPHRGVLCQVVHGSVLLVSHVSSLLPALQHLKYLDRCHVTDLQAQHLETLLAKQGLSLCYHPSGCNLLILVQVKLKRKLHQLNQHSQTDPIISTVIFQYQNPCIQKRMILILARKNQCHIKLQLPPQNQNSKDNTILKLGKKNQYHPSQHFPNIKIVLISIKK